LLRRFAFCDDGLGSSLRAKRSNLRGLGGDCFVALLLAKMVFTRFRNFGKAGKAGKAVLNFPFFLSRGCFKKPKNVAGSAFQRFRFWERCAFPSDYLLSQSFRDLRKKSFRSHPTTLLTDIE
jgi:hypothetical protein